MESPAQDTSATGDGLQRRESGFQLAPGAGAARRPHVIVVGAGFAGLNVVRGLRRADVTVTLIDRHNYHLFQPLLYQVATAALEPADISGPLRQLVPRWGRLPTFSHPSYMGMAPRQRSDRRTGNPDDPLNNTPPS